MKFKYKFVFKKKIQNETSKTIFIWESGESSDMYM